MNKGKIFIYILLSMFVIGLIGVFKFNFFDEENNNLNNTQEEFLLGLKNNEYKNVENFNSIMDWALFYAVYTNNAELLNLLIRNGADVNYLHYYFGSSAATPLMAASDLGYPEMVRILLKNNAFVSGKNEFAQYALIQACTSFYENAFLYRSLEKINKEIKIDKSVRMDKEKYHKQLEIIKLLTEKNNELINKKDRKGSSAFDYALLEKDNEIINYLSSQSEK